MHDFNTFFDQVFIINLNERSERWEKIEQHLKHFGFKNYQRIAAIRPSMDELDTETLSELNYGPEHWTVESFPVYLRGATGCLKSHIKALETAIASDLDNYLVFEDDAFILEGSQKTLNQAIQELVRLPSWDMFYLGGRHRSRRPQKSAGKYLDRVYCTYEAHAYSVNSRFYNDLHQRLILCQSEIDHFLAEKIHPEFDVYSCRPLVSFQSGSTSDIFGTPLTTRKKSFIAKVKKLIKKP
ncbi:MAG: glycosyltransferase family 25 protein [Endozoicomonas sp.]|uniref:glycosyltransferase family 25 protein n=1 Tax=Endozoicomonas sp. TaxID=1892382 RepID=UPI003D9B9273